ncbi:MAG TPA: sugar nucleotide-binding protein [Jatrophihabitans sp.]|nr:sugar nucleotide-binding protein [Jatrophihabitans sp.]
MTGNRVVIAGAGLIGASLAEALRARGDEVTTVSRRPAGTGPQLNADLGTAAGRARLRALVERWRPRCTVLVHGPSDVTWIEAHEAEAAACHVGTATALAGHRLLLVSTDNVFDGTQAMPAATDPSCPQNAYGRVKLAAERAGLAAHPDAAVARVSLVYGWSPAGLRATYAQRCLESAARGAALAAPSDQSFTPVHLIDVVTALTRLSHEPAPSRLLQLAGPAALSRYEFAALAYRLAGADPALVRPVPRAETEWACRPRHSGLRTSSAAELGFDWQPADPAAGLSRMLATVVSESRS